MTTTTWQEQRTVAIQGIANSVRTWIADESISPDYFEYGGYMGIEYGDDVDYSAVVINVIDNRVQEMLEYFEKHQVVPLPREAKGIPNQRIVDMCAYDLISRYSITAAPESTEMVEYSLQRDWCVTFANLHYALYEELGFQAEVTAQVAANKKAHKDAGCMHGEWDVTLQRYLGCVYTDPGHA